LIYILRILAAYLATAVVARRVRASARLARRFPTAALPAPERLRRMFEDLGGTFIKFGQMLALQPDILSLASCNALFDLLDRVEPYPYEEVRRIVAEELGAPPEQVFDSFDPVPLATASVGQVHVAWLDGRKVAVKVQRPRVEVEFASDLRLMIAAMAAIRWLRLRRLEWLLEPMEEFVAWSHEELDYRSEARYSEALRRFTAGNPLQHVPQVFTEYTTRRTLVVEYLDGVTLLDHLRARDRGDQVLAQRLAEAGFDPRRFAAHVIDNFLGDAFLHGLYHADLHPANLMVLPGNVVGYIDFGITGVLSPYSRRHLAAMTLALAQGDVEALAARFVKLAVLDDGSDVAGFRSGLAELARDWYEHEGSRRLLRVNFTRVMTDMLKLSRSTHVMPERDIVKYIRSAIAVDGLNLRFAPGFHVGRHLEQQCARFLRWQAVRDALSDETLLAWTGLGTRVLTEMPARTGGLIERLTRGELAVRARLDRGAGTGDGRPSALALAAAVLALAALALAGGDAAATRWAQLAAEGGLLVLGLGMLVTGVRRQA
jgi:ubiquinone biosynthesis protein